MIHEFAHSLLHKQTDKNSNQREIETEFSFELYEASEEFVVSGAAIRTKENSAEGAVTFDELTYEEAGTYYYVVAEKVGTLGDVTYDETKYFVTVEVTDDLEGQLHAEVVSITKEGVAVEEVVFENTYFVNTADTTTANGYIATMFASAIALIIAVSKKRKLSK